MTFRWEMVAAGGGLLLAGALALTSAGVGTYGTWDGEAAGGPPGVAAPVDRAGPFGVPSVTADELAEALMAGAPGWTVVDVRAGAEAPADRIPGSYWLPLDDEVWNGAGPFGTHRTLVIVAQDDGEARAAWTRVASPGYDRAVVLDGGMASWSARYGDPQEPAEDAPREQWEDYERRRAVALYLAGGVDALTAGAATGAPPPVAAPPPLPVRVSTSGPKAAEGC